jgi:hypothetical protein
MYQHEKGRFVRHLPNEHGSFRTAYASLISSGVEFTPPFQPDLVLTEKTGVPEEVMTAAKAAIGAALGEIEFTFMRVRIGEVGLKALLAA